MKLKYYMRGAGVGVLVTTMILAISFALYKPSMSQEEIEKKARALGMEYPQEVEKTEASVSEKENSDKESEAENKKVIAFSVASGDSSATVAAHLQEMGLVDNASAFDSFLSEQGLDNKILPGEYQLLEGSSYLEIAEALITKK